MKTIVITAIAVLFIGLTAQSQRLEDLGIGSSGDEVTKTFKNLAEKSPEAVYKNYSDYDHVFKADAYVHELWFEELPYTILVEWKGKIIYACAQMPIEGFYGKNADLGELNKISKNLRSQKGRDIGFYYQDSDIYKKVTPGFPDSYISLITIIMNNNFYFTMIVESKYKNALPQVRKAFSKSIESQVSYLKYL